MLSFERQAWAAGYQRVAGLDEAGRGPLAGPVVAATVCIEKKALLVEETRSLSGLTDSKKLSESRRDHFFDVLLSSSHVQVGVGEASVEEIDRVNILHATTIAMERAIQNLSPSSDHLLIDGLPVKGLSYSATTIVGGDGRSLLIAAASVMAKVTRDKFMKELDEKYPDYGFAQHKGYGTKQHLAALKTLGPTPYHRRSFKPVSQLELF